MYRGHHPEKMMALSFLPDSFFSTTEAFMASGNQFQWASLPVQFLQSQSQTPEDACCWHGCRDRGKLHRIRGVSVRALRYYCLRHATAVEIAGFRVFPMKQTA
jgi:hypothetical protein